jgi:hypothetical protein
MPPGAVFDFDDPHISVEADLPFKAGVDVRFRRRRDATQHGVEHPVGWLRLFESALRGRAVQSGGAIKPVDDDEDSAGFLSATPPHHRKRAFDLATAQIGRHPDAGLQPHGLCVPRAGDGPPSLQRPAGHRGQRAHETLGYLPVDRHVAIALEFLDRRPRILIIDAGRLDLTVAKIGERVLDREHVF